MTEHFRKSRSCLPVHVRSEGSVARQLKRLGPVDILVAHMPPFSASPQGDLMHQGFKAFDNYIRTFFPKYFIHGHLHVRKRSQIGKTQIISINEKDYLKINA